MDSLYILIPLSVGLVLIIGAVLAWAVLGGQFDDLEAEGQRVLDDTPAAGSTTSDIDPVAAPDAPAHVVEPGTVLPFVHGTACDVASAAAPALPPSVRLT